MTQPFKIQLNAEALEALFPEGTQARVELQNAVVAEFTRKHIREAALGPDVHGQIERARADAINAVKRARDDFASKVLSEQGIEKSGYGTYGLKNEAKVYLSEQVRQAIKGQINESVDQYVKEAVDGLKDKIADATQATMQRLIDAEIKAAVKARIASVVEGLNKTAN